MAFATAKLSIFVYPAFRKVVGWSDLVSSYRRSGRAFCVGDSFKRYEKRDEAMDWMADISYGAEISNRRNNHGWLGITQRNEPEQGDQGQAQVPVRDE